MGKIAFDWGNHDETLLIIHFQDGWTIDEYLSSVQVMQKMLLSKTNDVDIFVDFQHSQSHAQNLLTTIRRAMKYRATNVGKIIVITKSSFWKSLYETSKHMLPETLSVHFAPDSDEAYRILKQETTEKDETSAS